MLVHAADPRFAWGELDDCPTLSSLRDFLARVPDGPLLAGLRQARGHGRDDCPVERAWRVVLLTIALRHRGFDDCLAELHRNPALCRLSDIPSADQIPPGWNLSRFLDVLGRPEHLSARRDVFNDLAQRRGAAVPDLGRHTAGDATALSARPQRAPAAVAAEVAQGLPQPSGGRQEYPDDEGRGVKVYEGFGYQLHVLVDVKHEVAVAYHVTDTKAGDNERVGALVEQAQANLPEGRIETLADDKAADAEAVPAVRHEAGIKPLIQNRALWQGAPERPLPGGRYPLHLVPDEAGTVCC